MKSKTVFVKVYIKDELPTFSGNYHTSIGYYYYTEFYEEFKSDEDPEWWLKEIELPSEDDIEDELLHHRPENRVAVKRGIDYMRNKLK